MVPSLPPDLWVLVVVLGLSLLVGVPLIRATVHLPARLETELVPEEALDPRQRGHFQALDAALAGAQYRPLLTCRAPNLQGANLMRIYGSDVEPAVIGAAVLRSKETAAGHLAQSYLEIITELEDGQRVYTRNPQTADLFDVPPGRQIEDLPGVSDPLKLLARHRLRVTQVKRSSARYHHGRDLLAEWREDHERFCRFQVERGLLRPDPSGERYRATTRLALRGVFSFFNPLADNFTLPRFAAGLLLGMALPALTIVATAGPAEALPHGLQWLQPLAGRIALSEPARLAAVGGAFALAGAAVGFVFTSKALVWGLLLGYLPLRLLDTGLGAWSWGFVLLMGWAADSVARWRHRRATLV